MRFYDLPVDVTILILGYLEPVDVLNMRMTSKRLQELSMHRAAWLDVLYGVMLEHGIPLQTYPLPKFDQPLLEHLALSPGKFLKRIETHHLSDDFFPRSIQNLVSDMTASQLADYGIETLHSFQFLELAPGGRFLVTSRLAHLKGDDGRWADFVQLWDLGVPALHKQPNLIASKCCSWTMDSVNKHSPKTFFLSPSEDGRFFFLVIHRSRSIVPEPHDLVCLLKLKPFENPKIKDIAELGPTDATTIAIALSGKRLIIASSGSKIEVFDVTNTVTPAAAWSLQGRSVENIQMFGEQIFLLENGQISQWGIPSMNADDAVKLDHYPTFIFADLMQLPVRSDTLNTSDLPFNPWSLWSHLPEYMVLVCDNNLSLFEMELRPSQSDNFSNLDIFPRHIKTYLETYEMGENHKAARLCNKNLIFISWDPYLHCEVNIHLIPTNTSSESRSIMTDYLTSHGRFAKQASLCCATGRMCILTDNDRVSILDFLEAP